MDFVNVGMWFRVRPEDLGPHEPKTHTVISCEKSDLPMSGGEFILITPF